MSKLSKAEAARLNGQNGGRPRKDGSKPKPKTERASVSTAPETQKPTAPAPAVDNPHNLDPRELLFVECYCGVSRFNASDAYLRSGYKGTPGKVSGLAARLIARDRVAAMVADRLGERIRAVQMDGDEAIERLSRFARADIGQVLGPDDPLSKLPDEIRLCIKTVRPTQHGRVIELYDAMRATEDLAKAAGRLKETHEHTGKNGAPLRVVFEEVAAS